jgi:hypothetical protein
MGPGMKPVAMTANTTWASLLIPVKCEDHAVATFIIFFPCKLYIVIATSSKTPVYCPLSLFHKFNNILKIIFYVKVLSDNLHHFHNHHNHRRSPLCTAHHRRIVLPAPTKRFFGWINKKIRLQCNLLKQWRKRYICDQ